MAAPETLLIVFIGVVAAALLIQSIAFWGIHRSVRNISDRVDHLSKQVLMQVDPLSAKVDSVVTTIQAVSEKVQAIEETVTATASVVHKRVVDMDAFLGEATDAARLQVVRVQDVVDTASRRVEETFDLIHNSILAPVSEVNAIVRGIRVGLDVFFRRIGKPTAPSHQDEEMFI